MKMIIKFNFKMERSPIRNDPSGQGSREENSGMKGKQAKSDSQKCEDEEVQGARRGSKKN